MIIRTPCRVRHTFTQRLDAPVADVFPLLCPVREVEWVAGWAPRLVIAESGVAERDCVFVMPDAAGEATWVVTEHEPAEGRVEMLKLVPGQLVTRLHVVLRDRADGRCEADVTYTYTALDDVGEAYVRSRTPEAYAEFMREWERELNDHLRRARAA